METPPVFDVLAPGHHTCTLSVEPGAGMPPYTVPYAVLVGRTPRPRIVVTAGVHGDEFEGVRAAGQLLQAINPADLVGTLVVVPVAHSPAHDARTRRSPLDDADLNRTFPGDPDGTPTARLAAALMTQIVAGADLLIDLHSGGTYTQFAPMVGFRAEPEAVAAASYAAAAAFGLPWLWRMSPDRGVFSYEASCRGVPSIGVEAGGRGGCRPEDVAVLRDGVLRVLAQRGMLPKPMPAPPQSLPIYEGGWTLSPATGLWEAHVGLGDVVAAGQPLAHIISPGGEIIAVVRAPHAGMVGAIRTFCAVNEGDWAVTVFSRGV